ncbi:hypothetical protein [Beduinella massiliensis]|uniref:hypothetical protein n=1 Tax=Beduinella massiliensis TaxID=1852363 RepID=UPI000C83B6DF
MKCVNFDEAFERYAKAWMRDNQEKFGGNIEQMEAQMPDVYLRFINQKADWLDGETPALYFTHFDDADLLVRWMIEYFTSKVPVPDQLLERIVELGKPAEERLLALLTDETAPYDAVLTAITLLRELCSTAPMQRYIELIAGCPVPHEQADMCAESLLAMGDIVVAPILQVLDRSTPVAQEVFLDLLCNYPGDERIYQLALRKFNENPDRRALFASFLGKIGDPRAVPVLAQAATEPGTNYLDFVEISNAVEELGGDPLPERDFSGDPYFEALKQARD